LDTPDLHYPVGAGEKKKMIHILSSILFVLEAAAAYNSEPDQYIAVGRATYESNPIA